VTDKGKLLIDVKVGERRSWFYLYFDHRRTTELIEIVGNSLPVIKDAGQEWTHCGSVDYDVSDWLGGPYDEYSAELLVGAQEKSLLLIAKGHPKRDGEDMQVSLDRRVAGEVVSSLKKAEPYLKGVDGQSKIKFEPRDMVGRMVRYRVEPSESSDCPPFPPARVTKVIQGQFAQPNYVIEFAEPVLWKRKEGLEVSYTGKRGFDEGYWGMKVAVIMTRYRDRIESLLDKYRPREPIITHLNKFLTGVDPYEIRIARNGMEIERYSCLGYVRLIKPRKKLLKKFEDSHIEESPDR
jgi:hypothetical protein